MKKYYFILLTILCIRASGQISGMATPGFYHSALFKGYNSSLPTPLPNSECKPVSLVRLSARTVMPAQGGTLESNDVWESYYKQKRNKGIAMTTSGSVLLAGGSGMLIYGVLDFFGIINSGKYDIPYSLYYTNSGLYATHDRIFWLNEVQNSDVGFFSKRFPIDFSLIGAGTACILTGIIVTPLGSKYLRKSIKIKQQAAERNIILSAAPVINPVYNDYACSLKLNF